MKTTGRVLSAISAVLCAATLVLLLLDLVKPGLDLFLKASVKGCSDSATAQSPGSMPISAMTRPVNTRWLATGKG